MEDLTGQYIGGYELQELIATGGMASIYKGFDKNLSRWVAVKMIPIEAIGNAEPVLLARFRLEAQAIAALRHRNILTVYGYGEEKGWAYIVMEYVPGGSLKERIREDEPFDWERALTVIIPVSQALAFAHERGVIHRDIKPANILMPQEDWPLLADFGLAKMQHSSTTVPNLTMPGQVLGTMAYAAPEQIQEGPIDARVDIYSLGIVLYELLTCKLPFEGETSFDFLMARLTDPPIPVLEANSETPEVFTAVLDKALAQSPDERYQTMDELSAALAAARDELSGSGISRPPFTAPEPESEKETTKLSSPVEAKVRLKVTASGDEIIRPARPELIIGRSYKYTAPDVDLAPYGGSKAGVSRRHSRLVQKDGRWFIEDLGSTNGTFVNGVRVNPTQIVAIKDGDVVRCGQIELEFRVD